MSDLSEQPNKSATSKSAVFNEWVENPDQIRQTYPLVNDILNLLEHIQTTFDKKIPKGFTTLAVMKNLKEQDRKTLFTGRKISYDMPKQFLLPILASFRANIKYDEINGKIGWYEKPEDLFDKCKSLIIGDL